MWEKTLNKLFELMLKLDDYRTGKAVIDYTIKTIFNDYKIQTISDKTTIATAGINGKSWDIKSAVDYIHDDLTEEEKEWYWVLNDQLVKIQQEMHKLVVMGHGRRRRKQKKEAQCGNQ